MSTPHDGPSGFLSSFIDDLYALEQEIADGIPELHAYRWWEPGMDHPAIFNRLAWGNSSWPDRCTHREVLRLHVTISMRDDLDPGADMELLEEWVNIALGILDPVLCGQGAMGVTHAVRNGIRPVDRAFGGSNIHGVAFPVIAQLDRHF